jgi:alpha-glucosidase
MKGNQVTMTTVAQPGSATDRALDDLNWWRDAVVYQIYPRSFADGNGDGVGDLIGARQRLPYLADLGVDAIWLSPFYRSPFHDGGYDVSDYRDVDPQFGTLGDFDDLLAQAHRLGLRLIVDLVPNHTSSEHPWFRQALTDGIGSDARDRYIFRDGGGPDGSEPPNDWQSIFGGPAWTRLPDGQWYLHLFDPSQPDLNWERADVRAEFEDILRFWLDRGVDGFRVDVAHGLVKAPGLPSLGGSPERRQVELLGREPLPYFDQDGVHDIYRTWRPILDSYPGGRMAVAEAWVDSIQRLARYIGPHELQQAFNFDFMLAQWDAEALQAVIVRSLATAETIDSPTTWVLSNHDTRRQVTRYGDGDVGLRRARAAILLMLALPGAAYLYNGEELGLPEVLNLPDEARQDPSFHRTGHSRDGCRVPLPWSGTKADNYGFSSAAPWLPQPEDWAGLTVAAEEGDPESTLNLYKAAIRLRRTHPALGGGTLRWRPAPSGVIAFGREPGLTVVVNVSGEPVDLSDWTGETLLRSGPLTQDGRLGPGTAVWLRDVE